MRLGKPQSTRSPMSRAFTRLSSLMLCPRVQFAWPRPTVLATFGVLKKNLLSVSPWEVASVSLLTYHCCTVWQFSTGWALAQDDIRMEGWSRQLAEHLHTINKELGISSEFVYMGDAGEWQDPYAGFPSENVARMREIRSSYDPAGVFSTLSWGGFKLGM